MSGFAWPDAVYIEASQGSALAGLEPEFVPQWDGPNLVEWHEGGRVRLFEVKDVLEDDENRFRFVDSRGETFELFPMTLERYEKHVRRKTVGQPKFETLRELIEAMRREW
jgi:hypothetical protein